MITAHKYLNLDLSVINISALVIEKLWENDVISYDELVSVVVNTLGEKAKEMLPYALNFLFLVDKIVYLPQNDAFELNEIK